jgi:hypothetical protein
MALYSSIIQVLSECARIWVEMKTQSDPSSNGLAGICQEKFAEFAQSIAGILEDLDGYSTGTINNALSQLNPFAYPMYLHIHAAIPRRSYGNTQIAIPNQNNGNIPVGYITGKGRIHCLGLAGSYVPSGISMTLKQFDSSEELKREVTGWTVPVCNNNQTPTPGSYGGHFNSAYGWINYGTSFGQPPSHCSGLYPYFERFGYCENSHYTRFDVTCLPEGRWWSASCVWESDQPHNLVRWRDE